jgi:FlaA1/EpsC-like NDP-sugar epimerase
LPETKVFTANPNVAPEKLLRRRPIEPDRASLADHLRGRTILVTGAAGSIGSELCRLAAAFAPASIIAFEIAETPLFQLTAEMQRDFPGLQFHPEIGSIRDRSRLAEVLDRHHPDFVCHTAAYKHVPFLESQIFEAIGNNVFGTANVVEAARAAGVPRLVMISSDKAARPASIMGATKRIAEHIVRAFRPAGAPYVSVRFGNVLGSGGSVVPILKEQIQRGGPVTVTDPSMERFFVTAFEACALVLQTATFADDHNIYALDMGKPVNIAELARDLITLSGLPEGHNIAITFTGRRPGEKLSEDLIGEGETLLPTANPYILGIASDSVPRLPLEHCLTALRQACSERNLEALLSVIRQLVPDYTPGTLVTQTFSALAAT